MVKGFIEKLKGDGDLIKGGLFIMGLEVLSLIPEDPASFESGPLFMLASLDQMRGFRHDGFWQPMDTLEDR